MRRLHWPIILFQLVWFNLVVPGHIRGVVTVPGGDERAMNCGAACCAPGSSNDRSNPPTPDQQRRCAICYVAATYTVPVQFFVNLQPAERVEQLNLLSDSQVASLEYPNPYWPVGPPCLI